MPRLGRTIPALPVRDIAAATAHFGTREFATLDRDGNLIEFFRWR